MSKTNKQRGNVMGKIDSSLSVRKDGGTVQVFIGDSPHVDNFSIWIDIEGGEVSIQTGKIDGRGVSILAGFPQMEGIDPSGGNK